MDLRKVWKDFGGDDDFETENEMGYAYWPGTFSRMLPSVDHEDLEWLQDLVENRELMVKELLRNKVQAQGLSVRENFGVEMLQNILYSHGAGNLVKTG